MDDLKPAGNPVLCEVTGKRVPADETIVLDGKRVGAEGKAILLERMKSGKNGEVSLHPGWAMRSMAMVLDYLVALIVFYTLVVFILPDWGGLLSLVLAMAGVCAYYALMHGMGGQTLGKMACGLKVVRDDDGLGPIGVGRAFVRTLLHVGPPLFVFLLATLAIRMLDLPHLAGEALRGLACLGFLAPGLLAMPDSEQRALHDRLTGTRVVRLWALRHLASKTAQARQLRKLRAIALAELMANQADPPDAGPDENPDPS